MTDECPWCVEDLTFEPSGADREQATVDGVMVARHWKYAITAPGKPVWSGQDAAQANAVLKYLYGEREAAEEPKAAREELAPRLASPPPIEFEDPVAKWRRRDAKWRPEQRRQREAEGATYMPA
jgi:hypothetical protein